MPGFKIAVPRLRRAAGTRQTAFPRFRARRPRLRTFQPLRFHQSHWHGTGQAWGRGTRCWRQGADKPSRSPLRPRPMFRSRRALRALRVWSRERGPHPSVSLPQLSPGTSTNQHSSASPGLERVVAP